MKKKINIFLPVLILILACTLRIYKLGEKSLWIDEIWSVIEAKKGFINLIIHKNLDYHGYSPIHYLLPHFMLYLGKSEFLLRLPSVIMGVFAVYTLYLLGKYLFDRKTGLIAAFLLSVSSLHLEQSREVRYYSYLVLFSIISTFFLFKLLNSKREQRNKYFVFFVISTILNLATHPTAIILLCAQIVCLAIKMLRLKKFPKIKISPPFVVFSILILIVMVRSITGILFFLKLIHLAPAMPLVDMVKYVTLELSGSNLLTFIFIPLFIIGIIKCLIQRKNNSFLLLYLFFLPLIIFYFIRPQGYGFVVRYFIYILIPFILLISSGIVSFSRKKIVPVILMLIITIFSAFSVRDYYLMKKGDWRGIGKYLEANTKAGDMIIDESADYENIIGYYYDSAKKKTTIGAVLRTFPSDNQNIPFKRYFLQHQYLTPDRKANPAGAVMAEYEKIISFDPDAKVSPVYLYVSLPVWFWQEAEINFIENKNWNPVDYYGKKEMGNDNLEFPDNSVSYRVKIIKDGSYDFFASLMGDGPRGLLKYQFDGEGYSVGYRPKGDWVLKEVKLGTVYLEKGDHLLTFTNENVGGEQGRYTTLDYFYLYQTINSKK